MVIREPLVIGVVLLGAVVDLANAARHQIILVTHVGYELVGLETLTMRCATVELNQLYVARPKRCHHYQALPLLTESYYSNTNGLS